MQLLILITALLSALTGVAVGPRTDESRLARAEERLVSAAQAAVSPRGLTVRPAAPAPSFVRSLLPTLRSAAVAASVPLARVRFIE